jgi:phosphocarrier protein NPr/phosphocarrier protein
MSQPTARQTVTVVNAQGLHARPADLFARLANQFDSSVQVIKGTERVDGKSILSILTLAAGAGSQLEIIATGRDAEAAVVALCELVQQGFAVDEPTGQTSDSSAG